jgi:hypothetical protein
MKTLCDKPAECQHYGSPLLPNGEKCTCKCHLPLVTTHLCPNCFNGCTPEITLSNK